MSKRFQVLQAVKALLGTALPGTRVLGLEAQVAKPQRLEPTGLAVMRNGDPAEVAVDLSPLTYHYEHQIPVELTAWNAPGKAPDQVIDEMMMLIGQAVAANRTLGGLCDWLDASPPVVDGDNADGARPASATSLIITASYSTTTPLN